MSQAADPALTPEKSLYRVVFAGGGAVTLKAQNALKAEQQAIRTQRRTVTQVQFIRGRKP